MDKQFKKAIFLAISVLLLFAGLIGISRLPLYADHPFRWSLKEGRIVVVEMPSLGKAQKAGLLAGDRIMSVDGIAIMHSADLKFVFDRHKAGNRIRLTIERGSETAYVDLELRQKYHTPFIVVNLLLGLMFWVVGVFVYLKKQGEMAAAVFAWGAVILACTILMVREGYPSNGAWWEYTRSVLHFCLYPLVPAFILNFALLYSKEKPVLQKHQNLKPVLFIPGFFFILAFTATYLYTIYYTSMESYRMFTRFFVAFRIYMALYLLFSFISLIHSMQTADSRANRQKVQWIFWGIFVGAAPFIFLWTLPQALGYPPLIPEEINYFFMLLVPVAFGFSIIKYHAWDIEIIIQRSIVYSIVTAAIIVLYLFVAGFLGYALQSLSQRTSDLMIILFTLAAVALCSPLRQKVQSFVDRHFYRTKYNYRLAIREFSKALTAVTGREELLGLLFGKIREVVPVDKAAFYLKNPKHKRFDVIGGAGIADDEYGKLNMKYGSELIRICEDKRKPFAKKNRAEKEDAEELTTGSVLETFGFEILIPILLQNRLTGFLVAGRKLSDEPYFIDDFQLLTTLTEQSVVTLERLRLQEAMILQKAEKSKLEALNQLKSEFLSLVSHELRAPLASIQWSVENLLDGIPEKPAEKICHVLQSINDCSHDLHRMISNLLDVTKIEAGKFELYFESVDVKNAVSKTFAVLRPSAEKKGIRFEMSISPHCRVRADPDAFITILKNLVENAVKYSPERRPVRIEAGPAAVDGNPERIRITVIDRGIGILKDKHKIVFDRFERVKTDKTARSKGLGLGLHITKKLVELMGGRTGLESEPDKGSEFWFTLQSG